MSKMSYDASLMVRTFSTDFKRSLSTLKLVQDVAIRIPRVLDCTKLEDSDRDLLTEIVDRVHPASKEDLRDLALKAGFCELDLEEGVQKLRLTLDDAAWQGLMVLDTRNYRYFASLVRIVNWQIENLRDFDTLLGPCVYEMHPMDTVGVHFIATFNSPNGRVNKEFRDQNSCVWWLMTHLLKVVKTLEKINLGKSGVY